MFNISPEYFWYCEACNEAHDSDPIEVYGRYPNNPNVIDVYCNTCFDAMRSDGNIEYDLIQYNMYEVKHTSNKA